MSCGHAAIKQGWHLKEVYQIHCGLLWPFCGAARHVLISLGVVVQIVKTEGTVWWKDQTTTVAVVGRVQQTRCWAAST